MAKKELTTEEKVYAFVTGAGLTLALIGFTWGWSEKKFRGKLKRIKAETEQIRKARIELAEADESNLDEKLTNAKFWIQVTEKDD